jgi:hypothetical protein
MLATGGVRELFGIFTLWDQESGTTPFRQGGEGHEDTNQVTQLTSPSC